MELCNIYITIEEWLLLSIGELVQYMGTSCLVSVRINSNSKLFIVYQHVNQ